LGGTEKDLAQPNGIINCKPHHGGRLSSSVANRAQSALRHCIAWRELTDRGLDGSTIRHRLSALATLFDYGLTAGASKCAAWVGMRRAPVGREVQ
jgi:hypothetical protein